MAVTLRSVLGRKVTMPFGTKVRTQQGGRIQRRVSTSASYRATIRPGGRLLLPKDLVAYRIGQRVFFAVIDGSVVLSPLLRRTRAGRIDSARIRSVRVPEQHYSSKARS